MHLHADDPGAQFVQGVYLNGDEVFWVVEADDWEGWLKRYATPDPFIPTGPPIGEYPMMERMVGNIEIRLYTLEEFENERARTNTARTVRQMRQESPNR